MTEERTDYIICNLYKLWESSVLRNRSYKSTKSFFLPQYWPHMRSQEDCISVDTLIQQEAIGETFPQHPPSSDHWPAWDKLIVFLYHLCMKTGDFQVITDSNFLKFRAYSIEQNLQLSILCLRKNLKCNFPQSLLTKIKGWYKSDEFVGKK